MALDPFTADYTGATTTTLGNAVYVRLKTPLGSYWAGPALGSKLHELEREKDVPRIRKLAVQYAEDALKPLLADGRARKMTITCEQPHNGWAILLIEVEDASRNTDVFRHPVKVV